MSAGTGRPAVLVADGYGVRVHVRRGQLMIEDGLGTQRRCRELARVERDVRRLVILADTGALTLEAVRWCADVGIAVVQVDRDARVLLVAGAPGTDDARLRRAQAAAAGSPTGLEVARALLTAKLQGQAQLARTELASTVAADAINRLAEQLPGADLVGCRDLEAQASNIYFAGWAGHVQCRFAEHDQPRIPQHWAYFGARRSLIQRSATPRSAATPINALLNYGYALAEVECRLALLTLGLDPGMGIVHTDRKDRDSLALDLLEPLRPVVERHILTLLTARTFRAADFHETRRGACRLLEPLTHDLTLWMPTYATFIAPLAEKISHALARSSPGQIELRTPLSRANTTQAQQRGQRSANRRDPPTTMRPACQQCGTDLYGSARKLCPSCWSVTRNSYLAQYRDAQRQPAQPAPPTVEELSGGWSFTDYQTKILPRLAHVPLPDMQRATGLSNGGCSRIRRGLQIPNPKHWAALAALADLPATPRTTKATM